MVYVSRGGWELILREGLNRTHIVSPHLRVFQPEPRIRCRVLVLKGTQLGSSFRVQGSGFRVQGSGFRVQGSGFRNHVQGCPCGMI